MLAAREDMAWRDGCGHMHERGTSEPQLGDPQYHIRCRGPAHSDLGYLAPVNTCQAQAGCVVRLWRQSDVRLTPLTKYLVYTVSMANIKRNSAIAIGIGGMYVRIVLLTDTDETWWLTKLALFA